MDRIEDLVLWKTLNKQIGYYALPSGSKAEGMDLSGSDVDLMLIMKYITVEPKQFNQPSLSDFIMETKNVKSGFAKLILGLNKRTKDKLRTLASALMSIDNHLVYLSSSLFRDKFVELSRKHTKSNVLPHGPCATSDSKWY
ncbi:hypothetical protein KUTeg_010797 [Tegillarca granosa]|uniref:Polymerase nucleotidyl transferase domain-containing protein n=1 Tax=Tegillarca granosa TaxID=220873 RepID=A0ABQ9F6E1_TEGGR|nr:hypothetical protein KUTeg_010797 [Tegillarca granosa]